MGIDFRVYWESAWMLLHGLNPYNGIISSTFPLNYPPPALLFIWPLGLFTMNQAAPLWNIGSLVVFIASIYLVFKIVVKKMNWIWFLASVVLFTLFYFPEKFNLGNGQINNFILFFSVAGIYLYEKKHKSWGAILLAYATAIKLAPGIFLVYFLIQKDFKQIARVLIFTALLYLLPILIFGWDFQMRYYQEIFFYSFTLGAKDWYYNQSLFGLIARTFHWPAVVNAVFYVSALLIVFLTWWRGKEVGKLRALAAVSSLYLLVHPIALQHYFPFAVVPAVILGLTSRRSRRNWKVWGLLGVAYLLLAANIKRPDLVPREFNFILSHQFFGILILWLVALWRENIIRMIGRIWVLGVMGAYILMLLCRGGLCF